MTDSTHDAGVIQTLLERFNTQRLPRLLELKEKVNAGESLGEFDLSFLEEVIADAQSLKPMIDRHPEYQKLAAGAFHLYKEILDKAAENQKNS